LTIKEVKKYTIERSIYLRGAATMGDEVRWDIKNGTISSKGERVVMKRESFIQSLLDELSRFGPGIANRTLLRTAEITGLSTIEEIRGVTKDSGEKAESRTSRIVELFHRGLRDRFRDAPPLVGTIPIITWGNEGRITFGGPDDPFLLIPVKTFQTLKKEMEFSLGPEGLVSILRKVSRDAGERVGGITAKRYNYDSAQKAFESIEKDMTWVFPVIGWGATTMSNDIENRNFCFKVFDAYESWGLSEGKANCVITQNYFLGIGDGFMEPLTGMRTTGREVTCIAKGDPFCSFFIHFYREGEKPDLQSPEWLSCQEKLADVSGTQRIDPTGHPMLKALLGSA
jgi:predicted hydrocarbon binding protein